MRCTASMFRAISSEATACSDTAWAVSSTTCTSVCRSASVRVTSRVPSSTSVVPASIMPGYPFLLEAKLETRGIEDHLTANAIVGVPYSEDMIASARADMLAQANPDGDDVDAFLERYPNAIVRDFDGNPRDVTEMDALVAYLQMLGTLVDFDSAAPLEELAEEKGR